MVPAHIQTTCFTTPRIRQASALAIDRVSELSQEINNFGNPFF